MGPLCELQSNGAATDVLSNCNSVLSAYEAALTAPDPSCGADTSTNSFTWTPDDSTPDLVYYQVCFLYSGT